MRPPAAADAQRGQRIFFADPVLPDNGFAGQGWRDDFQLNPV